MKNMFRAFIALTLILALFCGCGKELTPEEALAKLDMTKAELSVADLTKSLAESLTFADTPTKIENEIALILYNLDGMCEEISAYGSTGATAEAVVGVRCADAETAGKVYDVLHTYRSEMAEIYSRYNTVESEKLIHSLLRRDGKYVFYCVSPDTPAAEAAYVAYVVANAK